MHRSIFPSGLSRRWVLQRSALGLGALGLADLWGATGSASAIAGTTAGSSSGALAGSGATGSASAGSLAVRQPHFAAKAKRVIHFFCNGGPSQVDTFDHKPMLAKYADQPGRVNLLTERRTGAAFPSPFAFRPHGESGIEVSDIFAKTAEHIDDIAVIRSMYAQVPNHEPSLMLMNCGDSVLPRPSLGAWVLYGLGVENRNLPGFVAMCPGGLPIKDSENWQSAFLPGAYQGTYIDSQHRELSKLIENIEHPQISTRNQRRQLNLLAQLNAEHRAARIDDRLDARIQSFELAFRMQRDAAEAFDISSEPQHIQEAYGDGVHGRQTLIARRLLERGVRFVQLWHGAGQPWDNHENIKDNHAKLAGQLDQPIAALLADLKQRGMFEDTLVLWGGEFGRTPTVEMTGDGKSKLGRDHNHYGFSVARGRRNQGGTVYGATDELGFKAVEKPMQRARSARHDAAPARIRPRAAHISLRGAGLPIDGCERCVVKEIVA
ncbi:MAG: DUF1501 domain-containing protein [Planctomycetaceae bacterium]